MTAAEAGTVEGGGAMTKRPAGALEHDIMTVLWNGRRPMQPGEIKDRLDHDLAYTSVATVLGRLQAKGWVTRTHAGRAFAYEAAIQQPDLAARRIADVLAASPDRDAALMSFVGTLSRRDLKALRKMLGGDAR